MEQIELEDFLLIAEAVTGVSAEALKYATKIGSAESALAAPFAGYGDEDFYPDFADRAAILCSRIVRNHPLPDGNKRTALMCMLDFIERNDMIWIAPDQDELAQMIEWLTGGQITEEDFITYVRAHVHCP